MGSLSNESFEEFLASLKAAGVVIRNEVELRERLAEAQRWRYAFATLAANGRALGISFETSDHGDQARIHNAFTAFQFPEHAESVFAESLKAAH